MDSITRIYQKIKENLSNSQNTGKILSAFLVSLIIFGSFLTGRVSVIYETDKKFNKESNLQIFLPDGDIYEDKSPKKTTSPLSGYILGTLEKTTNIPELTAKERLPETNQINENQQEGGDLEQTTIFASKTGKVYYVPNCKAGNRVKIENRIYFENEEHAQEEGLTKSKQCK